MVSGNDICHLVLPFYEAVRLHALTPVIVLGLLVLAWCVVVLVGVLANLEVCPQWCCQRACCLKHFNYTSKSMAWGKLCALFVGLLRLMVPGIVSRAMRVWGCIEVNGRMYMAADLREECHVSPTWHAASVFSAL